MIRSQQTQSMKRSYPHKYTVQTPHIFCSFENYYFSKTQSMKMSEKPWWLLRLYMFLFMHNLVIYFNGCELSISPTFSEKLGASEQQIIQNYIYIYIIWI
eukprot:gene11783-8094_t